jgi:UDP-N-acetylmuramyl pentapeptide phosphotransferase/UDP-N-acetylglucosamine-1-phosphate transferase
MAASLTIGIAIVMVLAFALSALATHRLARVGSRRWLLDHPNERSLHHRPTPRSGGLAIALAMLVGGVGVGVLTMQSDHLLWLGVGSLIIVTVSFRDDLSHVHPAVRISVHPLVGLMLVFAGFEIQSVALPGVRWPLFSWLAVIATCLYVAWLINLYNFMDGMDGFAGGMAVFGFGTFAVLGGLAGQAVFAGLSGVIAAAAGGFLLFNFPPARIFMGDAGSSLLGFLAAGLSLWAAVEGIFPLWIAILVFSPFIVDATVTLGRRLWGRERVWQAHKSHCYQRLVQLGWGHRRTALWEYLLMLMCSLSAVMAFYLAPMHQWWLLICWVVGYVILIASVNWLEGRVRSHETVESL